MKNNNVMSRNVTFLNSRVKIFLRFVYPERPTLYFAVCYLAISLTMIGGLVSPEKVACGPTAETGQTGSTASSLSGLSRGLDSARCTVVFAVIYFFTSKLKIYKL